MNLDKIISEIKEEAIKNYVPILQDKSLEFISLILKLKNPDNILEIGTATGYSALCFENLLDKDGIIDTIERDEERIAKAKENFELMKVKNI